MTLTGEMTGTAAAAIDKPLKVAMAWYRREQWPLLRAMSADGDKLEVVVAVGGG